MGPVQSPGSSPAEGQWGRKESRESLVEEEKHGVSNIAGFKDRGRSIGGFKRLEGAKRQILPSSLQERLWSCSPNSRQLDFSPGRLMLDV